MKTLFILIGLFIGSGISNASTQVVSGADKPARLYVQMYWRLDLRSLHPAGQGYNSDGSETYTFDTASGSSDMMFWMDGIGGVNAVSGGSIGRTTGSLGDSSGAGSSVMAYQWPASDWPDMVAGTFLSHFTLTNNSGADIDQTATGTANPLDDGEPGFMGGALQIGYEHCWGQGVAVGQGTYSDGVGGTKKAQDRVTYQRLADTTMKLDTGGKAFSKRQNLFMLSAEAWRQKWVLKPNLLGAINHWLNLEVDWPPIWEPEIAVDATKIQVDGKPLGSDGKLWRAYPDHATRDVTPKVKTKDFYTFKVGQQKYSMRVHSLTMAGDHSHTMMEDDGSVSSEHCLFDDETGKILEKHPVLYDSETGNNFMTANLQFYVAASGSDPVVIRGVSSAASSVGTQITFLGINNFGGFVSTDITPWYYPVMLPRLYTYAGAAATANAEISANKVDFYDPLTIKWRLYSPDLKVYVDLNPTECPVYVSLKEPETSDLYHTVVHLACKTTGATTEAKAVADTWGQFAGLGVTTWDGQKMYYYNPDSIGGAAEERLSKLLGPANFAWMTPHNGSCIAWADLLIACLGVNGVDAPYQVVRKNEKLFVVKNCDFIPLANGKYTIPNVPSPPPDGVAGQNTPPNRSPGEKKFDVHKIVKLPASCALNGSKIYLDPSYGITATDAVDYTRQAIAGWVDPDNAAYWIRQTDAPDEEMDFPY